MFFDVQLKILAEPMEKILGELHLDPLVELSQIDSSMIGKKIRTRGFVAIKRGRSSVSFIVLRDQVDTIQCIVDKRTTAFAAEASVKDLVPECYIELRGELVGVDVPVKGCTKKDMEIHSLEVKLLSKVTERLPFSLKDAGAGREERENNPSICPVSYSLRLDNRFLDFRIPSTQAIFRVVDGTMNLFREYLRKRKFIELKTTKIIESGSEGGANLFSMRYFGREAFLAQSPQLYKQMAVVGGFKRVFEIGHVYRAEESNINRYLSEFTGVDLEMEIERSYEDVIRFIYDMFVFLFDSLKEEYRAEIEIIKSYKGFEEILYGPEPVIIEYKDAVALLKDNRTEISDGEDFSRENEKKLGEIVKKIHGVDFFVVKDYPKAVRAFYTFYEEGSQYSHSYDFILRGEEILSGAERIHDAERLVNAIEERNKTSEKPIKIETLKFYIDAFKYGAPPHAGCGIGLERLLKSYFGFDDIRYFALFPRDPKRLSP